MDDEIDTRPSWTSRSSRSFPTSSWVDEGNSDDEIVLFGDEAEDYYEGGGIEVDYETYDDGYYFEEEKKEDLPSGYTGDELRQKVIYVKSSKDSDGNFIKERKDLLWCINNGCEEIEAGIWSGKWYFIHVHGEERGKTTWIDSQSRRLVKECAGKARTIDSHSFAAMQEKKSKGNRAFARQQYKSALDNYLEAEELLGGAVSGMYLVKAQRDELVKVLSNQAECYLRMHKYTDAITKSTNAIQLDKRHEKSFLRRAKAIVRALKEDENFDRGMEAQAREDLLLLMALDGQGASEADTIMKELETS